MFQDEDILKLGALHSYLSSHPQSESDNEQNILRCRRVLLGLADAIASADDKDEVQSIPRNVLEQAMDRLLVAHDEHVLNELEQWLEKTGHLPPAETAAEAPSS